MLAFQLCSKSVMTGRTFGLIFLALACMPPLVFGQCRIQSVTTECTATSTEYGKLTEGCVLSFNRWNNTPKVYAKPEVTTTGLVPFFKLAKSCINAVATEPPWQAIKSLIRGNNTAIAELILWDTSRFFIAAGFGFLWAFAAVIGGCVFLCCRCSGNCCASETFVPRRSDPTLRFMLTLGLGICACFLLGSATIMYLTNTRVGQAVNVMTTVFYQSIDRLESFTNSTRDEFGFITQGQIQFMANLMVSQVTQIGNEAASVGIQQFSAPVNATAALVLALNAKAQLALTSLEAIRDNTNALGSVHFNLTTYLTAAQVNASQCPSGDFRANCNGINSQLTNVKNKLGTYTAPSLGSEIMKVEEVLSRNIPNQVIQGLEKFNQLPCDIVNRTASLRKDVESQIDTYKKTIDDSVLPLLNSVGPNLTQSLKLGSIRQSVDSIALTTKSYDSYRESSGYALASFSLIVLACFVGGMTCGCCGFDDRTKATHRSTASNIGSNVIMLGVYLGFFFTFFLMILCTIIFFIGGHMHVVCPSLASMEVFTQTVDDVPGTMANYLLGKTVLNNGTFNLTIRSVLESCRKSKSAYEAMQLERRFNISQYLDSTSLIATIDNNLASLSSSFNLDANNFLTNDTRQSLLSFNSSGIQAVNTTQIRINAAQVTISPESNASALEGYSNASDAASMLPDMMPGKADLLQELENSRSNFTAAVDLSQNATELLNSLVTELDMLKQISTALEGDINNVLKAADNLTAKIESFTKGYGNQLGKKYADRLKKWITDYFTFATQYATGTAANCKPLADIYDEVVKFVCDFTVDTLNGFWLACGWACFFFLFSIVLGTKLVTFYRRMRYEDGFDDRSQAGAALSHNDTCAVEMTEKPRQY